MEEKKFNTEWLATFLFCLFLGVFGAHRFWTGKKGSAWAMLLITLFTGWIFGLGLFITSIWALVDLILIVCAKFTGKDGQPIPWTI
ncbi:TM2 domain-containing protein [bacterium]|nr:TM2 domain-containing protein [bacterium]